VSCRWCGTGRAVEVLAPGVSADAPSDAG
jgi:hypothetical protein